MKVAINKVTKITCNISDKIKIDLSLTGEVWQNNFSSESFGANKF